MPLNLLSILKKFVNIAKKVFLVVIVYFIIIELFTYFFNKDKPKITFDPIQKNRESIYKIINDKQLNSTKNGKLTVSAYKLIMCGFVGEACTDNPNDGDKNYNKSLFGFVGNLFVLPYANPPASGIYWVYSGLQNKGFVPKTYAAGVGFNSLSVFMPIWDAFRKVSYLLLVFVIVTIGFMIMFRAKLNPQTVITVENALPKIVMTLLLITFSYAIVGFAIDIMYLITIIGVQVVGSAGNIPNIQDMQSTVINSNIFAIFDFSKFFDIYHRGINAMINLFGYTVGNVIRSVIGIFAIIITIRLIHPLQTWIAGILGRIKAGIHVEPAGVGLETNINIGDMISVVIILLVAAGLIPAFCWLIIAVVVVAGLLFLLFRIFFLLLSSFIQIILYLIFAPIILLFEAIPGRSAFAGWLKNIIGNLIVFPAVVVLFLVTNLISQVAISQQSTFTLPFLSGINNDALAPLINAFLLMMIPDLVKTLKQSVIGKQEFQIPINAGTLFAGGAAVGSAMGSLQQLYYWRMGWGALFGTGKGENRQPGMLEGFGNLFKPKNKEG